MRIAVLDLGTNTFHLMICEVNGKKFKKIYKSKTVVKLSEGSVKSNKILPVPFQRGIDAIAGYAETLKEYKPDKVIAYATSAIRSSLNGKKFVAEAKKKTGIKIEVITGDREAELIYNGVRACVELGSKPSLIMDIGGGSTEFIIANDSRIFWKKSFDIGAARLLEMFHPSDPMKKKELIELEEFLEKQLSPLRKALIKYPVKRLIGSSGSFDTFAEMSGYFFHNKNLISGSKSFKFDMTEFKILYRVILKSTYAERMKMKGLVKMRIDMIVIAGICTNYIIKTFKLKEMYLSKYALKEGGLMEAMVDR